MNVLEVKPKLDKETLVECLEDIIETIADANAYLIDYCMNDKRKLSKKEKTELLALNLKAFLLLTTIQKEIEEGNYGN